MKFALQICLVFFLSLMCLQAQVKIGDNPQTIDPASLLELESNTQVLVLTRVNTFQMEAIAPHEGALVYNTDSNCLYYYTGNKWVNLCEIGGFTLTNEAIENVSRTISLAPTPEGYNLEVAYNSIRSENIVDGGINGVDIQDNSIGQNKLGEDSIGLNEMSDNSVSSKEIVDGSIAPADIAPADRPGQMLITNNAGEVQWQDADELKAVVADATLSGTGIPNSPLAVAQAIQDAIAENTQHRTDDRDLDDQNEIQNAGEVAVTATGNLTSTNVQQALEELQVDVNNLNGGGANTDEQFLSTDDSPGNISIENGNTITLNVNDGDSNDQNEIQDAAEVTIDAIAGITGGNVQLALEEMQTNINDLITGGGADGVITKMELQGTDLVVTGTAPGFNGIIPLETLTGDTGSTELADQVTITGDGTEGNEFKVESIGSAQIADGSIGLDDLGTMGADTNGQVMRWNQDDQQWVIGTVTGGGTAYTFGNALTENLGQVDVAFDDATIGVNATDQLEIKDGAINLAKLSDMGANANGQVMRWNQNDQQWEIGTVTGGGTAYTFGNALTETAGQVNVAFDDATIGVNGTDQLEVKDESITSAKIENGTIALEDLSNLGAVDGQILKWNNAANSWEAANESNAINGTENSIFFADANGAPINAEGMPGNEGGLFWKPTSRSATGALYVGLKPDSPVSDYAKMVIAERLGGLAYPLQIVNESNNNGAAAGILFSTNFTGTDTQGKGALVYQRTGSRGRGDFHFLQSDAINPNNPNLAQHTVMTIQNEGNVIIGPNSRSIATGQKLHVQGAMRLTAHFFDENGAQGTPGQVLSSTATGTAWTNALALTGNLGTTNLTQTTGEDRLYNLNGQTLYFDGPGNIGIGQFDFQNSDNTVPNSAEDKLDVIGQIRARNGFAASPGTANLPSYGFYTNDDNDTGMFRAGNNQIGFSTNGTEALRIDADQNVGIGIVVPTEKLHVNGNILAAGTITSTGNIITDGDFVDSTPDYVFQKYYLGASLLNPNYSFNDLMEVETFIQQHHHLPGVRSAQEVKAQGFWNLGEASRINLEKIEELFLHTIEQEKKIQSLAQENQDLLERLSAMEEQLRAIKELLTQKRE